MSKPTITIHNVETGEVITREMTIEELEIYESEQKAFAQAEASAKAQAAAKAALLERLGITEEEAKLLLG